MNYLFSLTFIVFILFFELSNGANYFVKLCLDIKELVDLVELIVF